jgi:hypothetical protein
MRNQNYNNVKEKRKKKKKKGGKRKQNRTRRQGRQYHNASNTNLGSQQHTERRRGDRQRDSG